MLRSLVLRSVGGVERNAVTDSSSAATAAQPVPGRWKALAVLAAGLSLIILDGTIVGVALPTMISALDLDLTDAQWVNAIYNVIFAALLLGAGRLGDRVGRRTTLSCSSSEAPCSPRWRQVLVHSSPRVPSRVLVVRWCCRPPCPR